MTYATNLAASEQEAMPELFEIISGGVINRYTNWTESLTFLGSTYTPAHIKRSSFKVDADLRRTTLSVAGPVDGELRQHMTSVAIEPTLITIYRAIYSDLTDYAIIFTGNVTAIAVENNIITAECETLSDILSVRLPKYTYQSWCNHTLFDGNCNLDDTFYAVDGTIVAFGATNATIQCGEWDVYDDGYFQGGKIQYGTDWRFIVAHTGINITMNGAFGSDVVIGTTLTAYPGCDGDPATCINKFDNFDHYVAFPYIPSSNPVIWGVA